jgi:hypothetical protein
MWEGGRENSRGGRHDVAIQFFSKLKRPQSDYDVLVGSGTSRELLPEVRFHRLQRVNLILIWIGLETYKSSANAISASSFFFNKMIMGISAINLQDGITDYHIQESATRRLAIEQADTVICLADHSKFGMTALNRICPVDKLDILVTGWMVPETVLEEYRGLGIRVYTAKEDS